MSPIHHVKHYRGMAWLPFQKLRFLQASKYIRVNLFETNINEESSHRVCVNKGQLEKRTREEA